ncbi:sugar kinase [Thalassotalea litorea]|uniref:Sugar kinase n=1 Tax=Thalassotalea litorea TaxID=2020715 RepID=A0A5R9IM55_9GAMM|nr:sugar kinase [Thalassotalea litorea]TLU65669.1 sugar kinase [Thalassotalea litorea]
MNKIVLMGECMIELLQDKQSGQIAGQSFAGDVYNSAVYLKRLFPAVDTKLLTAIGGDSMSDAMLSRFASEDLNNQLVFRDPERLPGIYLVQTDDEGERSFLYWRESAAARQVMQFVDAPETLQLDAGDVFFFTGISLAIIEKSHREKFWTVVSQLKQQGVKIAFDLNYRARLWSTLEDAQQQFANAYQLADILIPGVDDFEQMYPSLCNGNIDSAEAIVAFFQDYEFLELIIKNGEKNIIVMTQDERAEIDVQRVTNVVDTTSAGDSFNGAYLGARIAGKSMQDATRLAAKVAGEVIQHPGAIVPKDAFSKLDV